MCFYIYIISNMLHYRIILHVPVFLYWATIFCSECVCVSVSKANASSLYTVQSAFGGNERKAPAYIAWPASWSSGQGFWLLIMWSRVRFPVLLCEFFLVGEDPHGDHGTSSSYTYHHSHHWGNVAAPHWRPNLRSRLHYRHNQEGKPRSS